MPAFAEGYVRIPLFQRQGEGLHEALLRLCNEAEAKVRAGKVLLVLSDFSRVPVDGEQAVHALLATGAIHQRLVASGLRCLCNLIVDSATIRDPHHVACLIGAGATAVHPWLAYQSLFALREAGRSFLVITHYQRLLDHIKPDVVHIMADGRILKSGGPELAREVEQNGYEAILAEHGLSGVLA